MSTGIGRDRVERAFALLTCGFFEPEAGIEPATPRLRIVCSAKLSYSGEVDRL
jgi:hypothetical protein